MNIRLLNFFSFVSILNLELVQKLSLFPLSVFLVTWTREHWAIFLHISQIQDFHLLSPRATGGSKLNLRSPDPPSFR